MTDNNSPRANGYHGHGNGAANGRDPDTTLMLLDSSALPETEKMDAETAPDPWQKSEDDAGPAAEVFAETPDETDMDGADQSQPGSPLHTNEDNAAPLTNGHCETELPAANGHADELAEIAPEFTDEDRLRHVRMAEALLFASAEPLRKEQISERLPDGADVEQVLADLASHYAQRGVNLVPVAGGWAFRTATDLAFLMERERVEQRKLSRAALETLAIIAYHQPVTRAEIEDVRGVSVSKGTIDVLMEIGWVRVRGRRQTPGRPVTYGTSDSFLEHFGLERIGDLPGLDELKAAGLLDTRMPTNISIPRPSEEDETDEDIDEDVESAFAGSEEESVDEAGGESMETGDPEFWAESPEEAPYG
jgi:segregation and condensation protein B